MEGKSSTQRVRFLAFTCQLKMYEGSDCEKYISTNFSKFAVEQCKTANAGNFTCGPHVKKPHTQFTCVTCSLLVKSDKFTRV